MHQQIAAWICAATRNVSSYFLKKTTSAPLHQKQVEILPYPYLLKKKIGSWGTGISIITDPWSELDHGDEIASGDYFKQEYIEGRDEYTSHVIVKEQKIVFLRTLQFVFREKYFVKGKDFRHISSREVDHARYKLVFENILAAMNYQGICCFDYKVIDDKLKIFEVNPRYGSSLTRLIDDALNAYRGAACSPEQKINLCKTCLQASRRPA